MTHASATTTRPRDAIWLFVPRLGLHAFIELVGLLLRSNCAPLAKACMDAARYPHPGAYLLSQLRVEVDSANAAVMTAAVAAAVPNAHVHIFCEIYAAACARFFLVQTDSRDVFVSSVVTALQALTEAASSTDTPLDLRGLLTASAPLCSSEVGMRLLRRLVTEAPAMFWRANRPQAYMREVFAKQLAKELG